MKPIHGHPARARTATVAAFAFTAALALAGAGGAHAQERVLREDQVTRQALIDALSPPAANTAAAASAADAGDEPRSRSFRPATRPSTAAAAAAAARPQRAAILVTFVTNSADLTAAAKDALDLLADAMKSEQLARATFTIEGHADPRGSEALNLRLSQARADSVRGYLLARHGLPPERVNAVGKGSSAPMNSADPAAPENRRVTIVSQPG